MITGVLLSDFVDQLFKSLQSGVNLMKLRLGIACFLVTILISRCGRRVALTPGQPPRPPVTGDTAKYVTKVWTGFDNSQFRKDTDDTLTIETGTNHAAAIPAGMIRTFDVKHVMKGNTTSRTIITWYGEDAQNNNYLLGISPDGKEWDLVTDATPPMNCPGSLSVGMNWNYVVHLASGITMECTDKVVGTEWLSTEAGKFEAYKIEEKIATEITSLFGKTKTNTTDYTWVSPQVDGLCIKSELKTDVGQMGGEESRKMRLKELNLVETAHS